MVLILLTLTLLLFTSLRTLLSGIARQLALLMVLMTEAVTVWLALENGASLIRYTRQLRKARAALFRQIGSLLLTQLLSALDGALVAQTAL